MTDSISCSNPTPIVFYEWGENTTNVVALRRALYSCVTQEYFREAFSRYEPQKENIFLALRRLIYSKNNILKALFPKQSVAAEPRESLVASIKGKDISLGELRDYGVIPSYTLVKPAEDNNGGDDERDTYLYASLYMLPAAMPSAREVSSHVEEYKRIRPHVVESRSCQTDDGSHEYHLLVSVFGVESAMAVGTDNSHPFFSHFHLVPECHDAAGKVYQTEDFLFMDGMKVYLPVLVQKSDGTREARTIVLSATITILGGAEGFIAARLGTRDNNKRTYGLGGLSEILTVSAEN